MFPQTLGLWCQMLMQAATGSAEHQWVMVLGAVQSDAVPGSLGGSLDVCVFEKMRLSVGECVCR